MSDKRILGVSMKCFWIVIIICVTGIVIGSFYDYEINVALANKTEIGSLFATYGSYFSYCLYPASGACLYVGLRKKGKQYNMLASLMLFLGWFLAVYYSNSYNGKAVRALLGYTPGESAAVLSAVSWLVWAVLYGWVPFAVMRLVDDKNPDRLIAVGASILVAGIVADNVNLWLKQVGSRPRYKYLITTDDPMKQYREWWQMVPNLAGSDDNFKSWPSGNMTIASMMFALPMLAGMLKKKSKTKSMAAFVIACGFVLIYGYNRIHMMSHYLTDVCFGTLITYLIFAAVSTAFLKAADHC